MKIKLVKGGDDIDFIKGDIIDSESSIRALRSTLEAMKESK